jgi:hypothetical protein
MKMFYFVSEDGRFYGQCFFIGDLAFIRDGEDPSTEFVAHTLKGDDAAPEVMAGTLLFERRINFIDYRNRMKQA